MATPLLCPPTLWAQGNNGPELGSPFIRNYAPEEYHAHAQNWDILQNKQGLIYIANGDGVLEFDGHSWRLIRLPNHVNTYSLALSPEGNIYVGALGEFGTLTPNHTGQLAYTSISRNLPEHEKNFAAVWSIAVTTTGVYFKTFHKLFHYHEKKLQTFSIDTSPNISVINGEVLISTREGIHVMKENGPLLLPGTTALRYPVVGLRYILPYGKKEKNNHKVLIASGRHGVWLYDLGPLMDKNSGKIAEDFSHLDKPPPQPEPFETEADTFFRKHQFYTCTPVSPEIYAFGMLRGGILLMDRGGRVVRVINKNRGLRKDNVLKVYLDRDKNLWAGLNNGISYVSLGAPLTRFDEDGGLEDLVLAAARHRGRLYAAAFDGLFYLPEYRPDVEDDKRRFQRVEDITASCWTLLSRPEGLWVGSNFGLTRIGEKPGYRYYYNKLVYSLGVSKRFPDIIFMGLRYGLAAVRIKNGGREAVFIQTGKLADVKAVVRRIDADEAGNLWLSTQKSGVIYLKFTGEDCRQFDMVSFSADRGISGGGVRAYCRPGGVLAATEKGVYHLPLHGTGGGPGSLNFSPEPAVMGALAGAPGDEPVAVRHMGLGPGGALLVAAGKRTGLLTGGPEGGYRLHTAPFRKLKGTVENIFTEKNGVTWLCSSNGLFRFDPVVEKDYGVPFSTLVRRVLLRDNRVLSHGHGRRGGAVPEIRYRDNSLTFEYGAAFYEDAEETRFQYMLEGFEPGWRPWAGDRKAVYTNLPEGEYCFRVRARNIFGCEGGVASYFFRVLPPWYRTGVAYVFYVLLLLVLLVLAYLMHRRSVARAVLETHRKYKKNPLEPEIVRQYTKRLLGLMEAGRPYLDSSLNMDSLSEAVGIQRHYISQILNIELERSFYDFVNQYRIREAKDILTDPGKRDLNILNIALEVGFNSSVSFNRAFKRHTGLTPSQYRSRHAGKS